MRKSTKNNPSDNIEELSCLTRHSDFLKERLFGLSNPQGNHGESVKEAHFHLDNTPVSPNEVSCSTAMCRYANLLRSTDGTIPFR